MIEGRYGTRLHPHSLQRGPAVRFARLLDGESRRLPHWSREVDRLEDLGKAFDDPAVLMAFHTVGRNKDYERIFGKISLWDIYVSSKLYPSATYYFDEEDYPELRKAELEMRTRVLGAFPEYGLYAGPAIRCSRPPFWPLHRDGLEEERNEDGEYEEVDEGLIGVNWAVENAATVVRDHPKVPHHSIVAFRAGLLCPEHGSPITLRRRRGVAWFLQKNS